MTSAAESAVAIAEAIATGKDREKVLDDLMDRADAYLEAIDELPGWAWIRRRRLGARWMNCVAVMQEIEKAEARRKLS